MHHGFRPSWKPGTDFTSKRLLRAGIMLLGVQFSLGQVATSGFNAVVAVVVIIAASAAATLLIWRLTRTGWRLSFLIGIATCANCAIVAIAPLVKARDEEVSYASYTTTAIGMAAMLTYPLIGIGLEFDEAQYGMLAGAGIHHSAHAIASGFIFSQGAGIEATIVKLASVVFLAPLMLLTAWLMATRVWGPNEPGTARASVWRAVPWFALGFVLLVTVRSVGDSRLGSTDAWSTTVDLVRAIALGLITAAMAVVGLSTDLSKLRKIGGRPFVVGLTSSLLVEGTALAYTVAR